MYWSAEVRHEVAEGALVLHAGEHFSCAATHGVARLRVEVAKVSVILPACHLAQFVDVILSCVNPVMTIIGLRFIPLQKENVLNL